MPTLEPFYLTFRSGLHVGRHGIGQEEVQAHVPADTLFAALVSVRAGLKSDTGDWAKHFGIQPLFRLTSAFPYAGRVRFYPRPVQLAQQIDPKRWRKIQFVSEGVLQQILSGNVPDSILPPSRDDKPPHDNKPREGLTLQAGALWMLSKEIEQLPARMHRKREKHNQPKELSLRAVQRRAVWVEEAVPRVAVDRITSASEIYHTGRITYEPECGLWFGVEWTHAKERDDLELILRILGDNGLGAERSVGYGAFSFHTGEPIRWPDPTSGQPMLLLSRYYPSKLEAFPVLKNAAYELVHLAGHVQTQGQADQRRRSITLVAEGGLVDGSARGEIVNVQPTVGDFPHAVWRYGLALGIGMETVT